MKMRTRAGYGVGLLFAGLFSATGDAEAQGGAEAPTKVQLPAGGESAAGGGSAATEGASAEGALDELSLSDLLNVKLTIASLTQDSLLDSPSSVTTFSQQELRNMGIRSVEELFNYVPGYQTTRDVAVGDGYRISIRGRSKPLSEHILLLINGQRANGVYMGGPTAYSEIPVENIDHVEIIRGPGSALYGSNAFLGVVNVITSTDQNNASLQVGTQYARRGSVNLSHAVGPVSFSGFVRAYSDEGYFFSNVTDSHLRSGSTRDPRYGDDIHLTMKVDRLTVHYLHTARHTQDFLAFGTLQNRSMFQDSVQESGNARYELELSKDMQLNLFAGAGTTAGGFTGTIIPAGTDMGGFIMNQAIHEGPGMREYQLTSNADLIWRVHETNELLTGLSYGQAAMVRKITHADHDPMTFEYTGDIRPYGEFNNAKTRHILGAYLSDKQQIGDFLNLIAGARLDSYNDFGSSLNPRVAVVYKGPMKSSFRASYATAFRAPGFPELGDRINPMTFGNPNLKAEKIRTAEFGYTQWTKYVTGMVTYFHNTLTDSIKLGQVRPVNLVDNPFNAPTYENASDKVTNQGIEFELFAMPFTGFTMRGSFTHLFDADKIGMPGDFASLILNQRVGILNFNVNGVYRRKFDALPNQKDYVILNANVICDVTKNWKVRASGYNLLDEKYRTQTQVLVDGTPNRGATGLLGVSYEL